MTKENKMKITYTKTTFSRVDVTDIDGSLIMLPSTRTETSPEEVTASFAISSIGEFQGKVVCPVMSVTESLNTGFLCIRSCKESVIHGDNGVTYMVASTVWFRVTEIQRTLEDILAIKELLLLKS